MLARSLGWRLFTSVLLVLFRGSKAEVVYDKTVLLHARNVTATDWNHCVSLCLASINCVAVSYCVTSETQCMASYCGTIQLTTSNSCTTAVLINVDLVDGVTIPEPIYDWTLTDNCDAGGQVADTSSYCYQNKGLYQAPSLSLTGPSVKKKSFTPSVFYGSTVSWTSYYALINLSSISVFSSAANSSQAVVPSFSVFLFFKVGSPGESFKLFELQFLGITFVQVLSTVISSTANFYTNLTGCGDYCTSSSNAAALYDGNWYYTAYSYDQDTNALSFYLDGVRVSKYSFPTKLVAAGGFNQSAFAIGSLAGGSYSTNFSVYCAKVFGDSLTVDEVRK